MKRIALVVALLLYGAAAHAATIVVDGGACQLADAIAAANTDAAVGGCPAGAGADVIELQVDVLLSGVSVVDPDLGPVGLPVVVTPLTIDGRGHTIARDPSAPLFRLLAIKGGFAAPGASLDLRDVTLTGGNVNASGIDFSSVDPPTAAVAGGALMSLNGVVTITDSTLVDNEADTGGAVLALGGSLEIFNSELSRNVAEQSGGAVYAEFATVVLRRSRIDDNVAGRAGGGVAAAFPSNAGRTVDVVDSAFHRNTSRSGGAVALLGSSTQGRVINTVLEANFISDPGTSTLPVFPRGGGAFSVYNASRLEVRNSRIAGNAAGSAPSVGGGGAIVEGSGATITMVDSEVTDNVADNTILSDGGGVAVGLGGVLRLRGSIVARNKASSDGGGVNAEYGLVEMAASAVTDNDSGNDGGGLAMFQMNAEVTSSRITGNRAVRQGGGIRFENGTSTRRLLTVSDSTVAANVFRTDLGTNRLEGAGVHLESFVDAVVERSTIAANIGRGWLGFLSAGTALYANSSASVSVSNSTIAGNDGLDAGGGTVFSNNASNVNLSHVTIVGNTQAEGGGIRNLSGVSLRSVILADNESTRNSFENCAEFFPPTDDGGNIADDASCGVAVESDAALALQAIADNGGATATIALGPGSAAIDRVAACPEVGDVDQRGVPRDGSCDAGAYEAGQTLPLIGFETAASTVYEGVDSGVDVAIAVDKRNSNLTSGQIRIWPILRGSAAPAWDFTPSDDAAPVLIDLSGPDAVVRHLLHFDVHDDQEAEGDETVEIAFVFAGPAVRSAPAAHTVTIVDDDSIVPNQCTTLQTALQLKMGDEDPSRYRNHGKYVSPVARATSRALKRGEITPECQGCIVRQFARSIPIAEQTACGGSPVLIGR